MISLNGYEGEGSTLFRTLRHHKVSQSA